MCIRDRHKVIYELDGLPEPEDLLAKDYTELLQILYREKAKAVSVSDGAVSYTHLCV